MADERASFDFAALLEAIKRAHERMAAQAGQAVNIALTMRNWFIGLYIAHYEMHGADRADYGENLLAELSAENLEALRKALPRCNIAAN